MSNSILPKSSSTKDEKALEHVALKRLDLSLDTLTVLPLKADEKILPYLAYMFDVDISNLETNEQRILIQNALEIHRYEGTIYAVKKAIDASFDEAFIMEWFDCGKEAYTFDVKVKIGTDTTEVFDFDKFKKARELINSAKNARSHFHNFIIDLPDANTNIQKAQTSGFNIELKGDLQMKDINHIPNLKGVAVWII